jgi:spectinomycin phosphotransferase
MITKPDIADELIISRLQDEYEIHANELNFRPSGDLNAAAYRVITDNGARYFLKLRKGFDEIAVTVPLFLKSQGIEAVIIPYETKSKRYWVDFGDYKIILYPFVDGRDGFDMELSDKHRRILGAELKRIHTTKIPLELKNLIPQETYSPRWREIIRSLQVQAENNFFHDSIVARLAKFIKSKRDEITRLVERAEQLSLELQSQPSEFVLCHTDIHGRNILMGRGGRPGEAAPTDNLYIVDWDAPLLAPKERDLMFIGGGIDEIWKTEREQAMFYEGYGKTDINLSALAYYRYERIIQDVADYGEQVLLSEKDIAEREQFYKYFTINFVPGTRLEIARKTDELL